MCTFAKSINVDLVPLIPTKYTVNGCLNMLMTSLSPEHSTLMIDKSTLYEEEPVILPPHMRTSRGRTHVRGMLPGSRLKRGDILFVQSVV